MPVIAELYLLLFRVRVVHSLELKDLLPPLSCGADHSVLVVKFQTAPPSRVQTTAAEDSNIPSQLLNLINAKYFLLRLHMLSYSGPK